MRGEAVAEAHLTGRLSRVAAGAKQPDRRQPNVGWHRDYGPERMILWESLAGESQEFSETLREVLCTKSVRGAAQGRGRDGVGARSAADAEIDAARMQGLQDLEGLGDLERGMVGEHDPHGADPDPLCHARDVPDHDLRCGAGDAQQIMVLGQPVALVAEPIG